MKRIFFSVVCSFLLFSCTKQSDPPKASDGLEKSPVDALAERYWAWTMQTSPTWASYLGDHRFGAELSDISEDARLAERGVLQEFLEDIGRVQNMRLPRRDALTLEVLRQRIDTALAAEVCRSSWWDIDQLSGYHVTLPELATWQSLDSKEQVADFLLRLSKITPLFWQHQRNLELGLASGHVAPKLIVERVIEQLDAQLEAGASSSPYLRAADRLDKAGESGEDVLGSEDRARFRSEILAIVEHDILPTLKTYRGFLHDNYLKKARLEVGVSANPDGVACYAARIQHHVGLPFSPEHIHKRGLDELKGLHKEMEAIAMAEGHKDRFAYELFLKEDAAQMPKSEDELLSLNKRIVERAQLKLPEVFGRLPKIPVEVMPIEDFRAPAAPAAYYYGAPDDGSRPAYYYVNTHQPETRLLYNMEALAFHEAVPGHHLQIALAQEMEAMPDFRRHSGFTAYVEGWALYAEVLADELGLYSTPASKFGMLNYQAWRAARLVVDTGLHTMRWDRKTAIEFMNNALALPKNEIENEVDRYIIWPGQALAYMLGRMEIQSLRASSEEKLGENFDLKAFHDEFHAHGALPLPVLRKVMEAWLSKAATGH